MSVNKEEMQKQALARAVGGMSTANYHTIIDGFLEKGIPLDDIKPRENVFTFDAWKAKGRIVKRGEHGVKVLSFIDTTRMAEDGTTTGGRRPKSTTVFHITQTKPIEGGENGE